MDRENIISGQIVLREASQETPKSDNTDRKLMMVIGVIAVPKHLNLKGEHKYTIAGNLPQNLYQLIDPEFGKVTENLEEIQLTLFPETGEDLTEETKGNCLSGIITAHGRWRV